jgi:hypothetical protein
VITESRVLLEAQEGGSELLNSGLCLLFLCLLEIFRWELGCDYLCELFPKRTISWMKYENVSISQLAVNMVQYTG